MMYAATQVMVSVDQDGVIRLLKLLMGPRPEVVQLQKMLAIEDGRLSLQEASGPLSAEPSEQLWLLEWGGCVPLHLVPKRGSLGIALGHCFWCQTLALVKAPAPQVKLLGAKP
jgi:hypothetical protein